MRIFLARRPGEIPAAEKMEVNVVHALAGTLTAVGYNAEAIVEAKLLCELCGNLKDVSNKS